ncbi:MAG: DUF669 domain-containing protein [Burkholderiales bacterium]
MSLITGFDANAVEPSAGFDDLPEGQYVAEIIKSEEKGTKDGKGKYLALTWSVSDGKYAKRQAWTNLNLDNPSAQAVNIAKAELSAICRATGVMQPRSSEELHLKRCRITIKHKPRKDGQGKDVRIVKYESLTAAPAATGEQGQAGNAAPWQKRA